MGQDVQRMGFVGLTDGLSGHLSRSKYGTNFVKRWTVTNKHGEGAGINSTVQLVMQVRVVKRSAALSQPGSDSRLT